MGLRGPPKTPTVILENRGSWRAKTRPGEPKAPAAKNLSCPNWVRKDAVKYWKEIVPHLEGIPGLLAKCDRMALGMLCDALALYVRASKDLEKHGITVDGRTNPAGLVQQRAWMRFARLVKEFGLSPASRAGLSIAEAEGTGGSDASRFFSAG